MSEFQFLKIQFSFWLSELHHGGQQEQAPYKRQCKGAKSCLFSKKYWCESTNLTYHGNPCAS